jgi:hypothetical protein
LASLLVLVLPSTAQARSLVAVSTTSVEAGDPFAVGRSLVAPNTLKLRGLKEYMRATGDGVTLKAFSAYGASFSKYWGVTRKSRSGKAFEAIVASRESLRLARTGDARRLIVTAAEGGRAHPADLLLRSADSAIARQYQLKLGAKAGAMAVTKEKYAGMTILLPRDQMKLVARKLAEAEAKAARRGLPLAPRWRAVKEAIEEGRLTSRLPSGTLAPSRRTIERFAKWHTGKIWKGMDRVGTWVGRGMLVVDVAEAGYTTYSDIQRYRAGEIGGEYLAARGSLRTVQVGLGIYAAVTPDPFSKAAAAVGIVVIIVSTEVIDSVHEARRAAADRLIADIDRTEQYRSVQRSLLRQIGSGL